jgi:hypothetical protein
MKPDIDNALGDYRSRVHEIGSPLLTSEKASSVAAKDASEMLIQLFSQYFAPSEGVDMSSNCSDFRSDITLVDADLLRSDIRRYMAFATGALIAEERGLDPSFGSRTRTVSPSN